jgi:hypothetical protein
MENLQGAGTGGVNDTKCKLTTLCVNRERRELFQRTSKTDVQMPMDIQRRHSFAAEIWTCKCNYRQLSL